MGNRRHLTTALSALICTVVLGLILTFVWHHVAIKSTLPFRKKECDASEECRSNTDRVLLDMRYRRERRQISDEELRADGIELVAVNKRVLPEVFPNGYLERSHSECDAVSTKKMADDQRELEWARKHGYFRPVDYKWRGGSFTEPYVGEALYQINAGECNAQSGPLAHGSTQLVVYRGPTLKASFNTLLGEDFIPVGDLNGDGVDELLLARDNYDEAGGVMRLTLVSLKGGELQLLHDFGTFRPHYVWNDLTKRYDIEVGVLSYSPNGTGRQPDFHCNVYLGNCEITEGKTFPNHENCWPNSWTRVRRCNN